MLTVVWLLLVSAAAAIITLAFAVTYWNPPVGY